MSTNAESALIWLDENNPSTEEIQEVADKLLARVGSYQGEPSLIQGSIEALELLQQVLSDRTDLPVTSEPEISQVESTGVETWKFDTSPLGEPGNDLAPAPETDQEKRKRFEKLKDQLGQ